MARAIQQRPESGGLRLPRPINASVDDATWRVLTDVVFPSARDAESILLAIAYCKSRRLDIMRRPVHIVPTWSSALERTVETIWPSIIEAEITAARTGQWAGMDAPLWGPNVTETFKGSRRIQGARENVELIVTYPEWCQVTIWRIVGGERRAFCEPVYWRETYARIGGGPLPNDMWCKRPRGQLHKCAKAASLRAAFPEESGDGFDEAELGNVDAAPTTTAPVNTWTPPEPYSDEAESLEPGTTPVAPHVIGVGHLAEGYDWVGFGTQLVNRLNLTDNAAVFDEWVQINQPNIEACEQDASKVHQRLIAAINKSRERFNTDSSKET